MSIIINNGFCIVDGQCSYNGKPIPNPPRFKYRLSTNITTIDDRIYLNGYEYFPEKRVWRITLKSIWHYFF